jgi:hypothetical protein
MNHDRSSFWAENAKRRAGSIRRAFRTRAFQVVWALLAAFVLINWIFHA